ncbi:hypothetical protein V8C34DRAFT_277192 [Trichoderma compactum]
MRFQRPTATRPKKLWAPDPLLARAQRSGKASCHSSMPIYEQLVAGSGLCSTDETGNKQGPKPRSYAKRCCWFGRVPADWSPDRLPFHQPSGERMHESSGGLLRAAGMLS